MFLKKMNTRRWRTLVLLQRKMNKDEDGKEEDEADDDAGTFKLFKNIVVAELKLIALIKNYTNKKYQTLKINFLPIIYSLRSYKTQS